MNECCLHVPGAAWSVEAALPYPLTAATVNITYANAISPVSGPPCNCPQCPPGTASPIGGQCRLCPPSTFATDIGSPTCSACPSLFESQTTTTFGATRADACFHVGMEEKAGLVAATMAGAVLLLTLLYCNATYLRKKRELRRHVYDQLCTNSMQESHEVVRAGVVGIEDRMGRNSAREENLERSTRNAGRDDTFALVSKHYRWLRLYSIEGVRCFVVCVALPVYVVLGVRYIAYPGAVSSQYRTVVHPLALAFGVILILIQALNLIVLLSRRLHPHVLFFPLYSVCAETIVLAVSWVWYFTGFQVEEIDVLGEDGEPSGVRAIIARDNGVRDVALHTAALVWSAFGFYHALNFLAQSIRMHHLRAHLHSLRLLRSYFLRHAPRILPQQAFFTFCCGVEEARRMDRKRIGGTGGKHEHELIDVLPAAAAVATTSDRPSTPSLKPTEPENGRRSRAPSEIELGAVAVSEVVSTAASETSSSLTPLQSFALSPIYDPHLLPLIYSYFTCFAPETGKAAAADGEGDAYHDGAGAREEGRMFDRTNAFQSVDEEDEHPDEGDDENEEDSAQEAELKRLDRLAAASIVRERYLSKQYFRRYINVSMNAPLKMLVQSLFWPWTKEDMRKWFTRKGGDLRSAAEGQQKALPSPPNAISSEHVLLSLPCSPLSSSPSASSLTSDSSIVSFVDSADSDTLTMVEQFHKMEEDSDFDWFYCLHPPGEFQRYLEAKFGHTEKPPAALEESAFLPQQQEPTIKPTIKPTTSRARRAGDIMTMRANDEPAAPRRLQGTSDHSADRPFVLIHTTAAPPAVVPPELPPRLSRQSSPAPSSPRHL
jgi:hypothetical protein